MSNAPNSSAVHTARAAREGVIRSRGFEWFSRSGFVARGLIYAIIGVLALKLALGHGGKVTNQEGALHTVARQPFGKVLITLVAVGLGAYALWRLVRAATGHGPEGSDTGLERVAALGSGLFHLGMCVIAVRILAGSPKESSSPEKTTAGVLGWPAGTWIVTAAGLVLIGVGLFQGYRGLTRDFLADSKTEEMGPLVRTWIGWIGLVGYLARMVVSTLAGAFLVKAAVEYDPRKAVGVDGALAELLRQPYGPLLLGLVAVGLIAFAVYSFSDARFRRI